MWALKPNDYSTPMLPIKPKPPKKRLITDYFKKISEFLGPSR